MLLGSEISPNSSILSEVLSFEILASCFGASLVATEMELQYNWGSKITDYSCKINNHVFGVSVTRMIGKQLFREVLTTSDFCDLDRNFKAAFTREYVSKLLEKKLFGILSSTEGVFPEFKWEKQVEPRIATLYLLCAFRSCMFGQLLMLSAKYSKKCTGAQTPAFAPIHLSSSPLQIQPSGCFSSFLLVLCFLK